MSTIITITNQKGGSRSAVTLPVSVIGVNMMHSPFLVKIFGGIKKSAKKLPLTGMVFLTLISIINSVCVYAHGISRWEAQKSITGIS